MIVTVLVREVIKLYPVYDLGGLVSQRPEALGTKEKWWFTPEADPLPQRPHLFKIGRPGTGENWAEKVTCEILRLLQIPCAGYDFAFWDEELGVISEQFFGDRGRLLPANMLLATLERSYDGAKRWRQSSYTLPLALGFLQRASKVVLPPRVGPHDHLSTSGLFAGYILFDCLVGNTDRHHENWGVVVDRRDDDTMLLHLAPSFDHASSLGRNELDERRLMRLTTTDRRASVEAYAARAKSAFFPSTGEKATLCTKDLVSELATLEPEATHYWANRMCSLTADDFDGIFGQIDAGWISGPAIEFAKRMLNFNQAMIEEVVYG